jgi:hypothetical protein
MTQEITQVDNPAPVGFTPGEQRLMNIFAAYLSDLFRHDDLLLDAPLREHITEHLFDDVDAASYAAANEAPDLAEKLTRRAHHWHTISKELAQFLAIEGPDKLDDLPTVSSMAYRTELEARYGDEMRAARHA